MNLQYCICNATSDFPEEKRKERKLGKEERQKGREKEGDREREEERELVREKNGDNRTNRRRESECSDLWEIRFI